MGTGHIPVGRAGGASLCRAQGAGSHLTNLSDAEASATMPVCAAPRELVVTPPAQDGRLGDRVFRPYILVDVDLFAIRCSRHDFRHIERHPNPHTPIEDTMRWYP